MLFDRAAASLKTLRAAKFIRLKIFELWSLHGQYFPSSAGYVRLELTQLLLCVFFSACAECCKLSYDHVPLASAVGLRGRRDTLGRVSLVV